MENLLNKNDSIELNNSIKKININQGLEMINIEPGHLYLYLNMIGGHSFFVVYKDKYLIKSVGQKELKFY